MKKKRKLRKWLCCWVWIKHFVLKIQVFSSPLITNFFCLFAGILGNISLLSQFVHNRDLRPLYSTVALTDSKWKSQLYNQPTVLVAVHTSHFFIHRVTQFICTAASFTCKHGTRCTSSLQPPHGTGCRCGGCSRGTQRRCSRTSPEASGTGRRSSPRIAGRSSLRPSSAGPADRTSSSWSRKGQNHRSLMPWLIAPLFLAAVCVSAAAVEMLFFLAIGEGRWRMEELQTCSQSCLGSGPVKVQTLQQNVKMYVHVFQDILQK